jgi:hypothetical protein
LGAALLCVIHGAIVENILVGDDDTNTLRAFNLTQIFLHLKKYYPNSVALLTH